MALHKCSVLHLGPNFNSNFSMILLVPFCLLQIVVQDLGVFVSSNLKFTNHCDVIVRKARTTANVILPCFENKQPEFLIRLKCLRLSYKCLRHLFALN